MMIMIKMMMMMMDDQVDPPHFCRIWKLWKDNN